MKRYASVSQYSQHKDNLMDKKYELENEFNNIPEWKFKDRANLIKKMRKNNNEVKNAYRAFHEDIYKCKRKGTWEETADSLL